MVDRHLGQLEASLGDLGHHLDADDAAVTSQLYLVKDVTPDQPHVAVHVADRQSEHRLDDGVIDPADDLPMERVAALDLVPLDHVHVVTKMLIPLDGASEAMAALAPAQGQELIEFLESLVLFSPPATASNLEPKDPLAPDYPVNGHGGISLTVLFNDPSDKE